MYFFFSFLTMFFIIFDSSRVSAITVSYRDIDQYFEENHSLLEPSLMRKKMALVYKNEFSRSFLPKIDIASGYEQYESSRVGQDDAPNVKVEMSVNLYRGGQDELNQRIRDLNVAITDLSVEELRHHLIVAARNSFWSFAALSEKIRVTQSAIDSLDGLKAHVAAKVKSGLVPRSQITSIELRLTELAYELDKLVSARETEKQRFIFSLGLPFSKMDEIRIDYANDWSKKLQLSTKSEFAQTEIIKRLQSEADRKSLQLEMLDRSFLPRVDFYSSYALAPFREREYSDLSDRQEWAIGVRLSIPISQLYLMQPQIREMRYKAESFRIEAKIEEQKMAFQRRALTKQLENTLSLLKKSQSLRQSQEKLLKEWKREFTRGYRQGGELIDLLTAMGEHEHHMVELRENSHIISECLQHIEIASLCLKSAHEVVH